MNIIAIKRHCSRLGRYILPLLACMIVLSGSSLRAQSDTGRVVGTVSDMTGAVVPGATINLTNTDTGISHTVTAGEDGTFSFAAVTRGNYRIEASHDGFDNVDQSFTLQVSQVQTIDFKLKVGASTQTVQVTDAAPIIDLSISSTGAVIDGKQVTDLPPQRTQLHNTR